MMRLEDCMTENMAWWWLSSVTPKLDYFGSVNDAASAARHPLDAEILKPRRWQK